MQLKVARWGALLLGVAALCGCVSTYAPAVIVEQTAGGRSELSGVIAEALHRDRVVLADDALTAVSSLAIERTPVRDGRGLLLNGRDLSRPETFQLYLFRGGCVLVHSQSGQRWALRKVKCRSTQSPSRSPS